MKNRYKNRLDASRYQHDEKVQLRLQPDPKDDVGRPIEGWISERLLARLRHLAMAYELPLLARLPALGLVSYPEIQISSIYDELEFVFDILHDDVLLDAIAPLRDLMKTATREPRGWSLVAEAP